MVCSQDDISQLSIHHARTMDSEKFKLCQTAFEHNGARVKARNWDHRSLSHELKSECSTQSYWSSISNTLLCYADAICPEKPGNPVIVIGDPKFSPSRKGHSSCPPKKIVKWLARFFTLVSTIRRSCVPVV